MAYWKCPICGYEATTELEKENHMNGAGAKRVHMELLKEKSKHVMRDMKDAAEDIVDNIADRIR